MFDLYFYIWSFFIPITSVVLIPTIKGSLPSYFFASFSMILILLNQKIRGRYGKELFLFLFLFLFCNLMTQIGNLTFDLPDTNITFVNPYETGMIFRSTLATQSLYLFMGVLTFLFVRFFYNEKFDQFIFLSGLILVLYGIYEIGYFFLFQENGDFLSNRWFGEQENEISGSLFQTIQLGGVQFQRLKSLTGEPSMFAMTILPYWIFSIHKRKILYQSIFFSSLLLSTSTTGMLGIFLYLMFRLIYFGLSDKYLRRVVTLFLFLGVIFYPIISDLLSNMLVEKILLEHVSGIDRMDSFLRHVEYFFYLPFLNQIFGIGFGYIRSTDFFSTLLVNTGVSGLIFFTAFFFYPIWKMKRTYEAIGMKSILVILYIVMMVSVPEFSYLSVWMFLGISYNSIQRPNKIRKL